MEGHRYADDPPSWYAGQGQHSRPLNPETSGAFRLPEQRPAVMPGTGPYASPDPVTTSGSHALRGPEYPTVKPPVAEPTALVPPVIKEESVYQTRRPVSSFVVAVVMAVLMIPVLRLLFDQTFTGTPTARGVVPAVLLTLGFALTGIGLFSIARGGPIGRESWLRPPVAYLPAGLILLVAAGLAVA